MTGTFPFLSRTGSGSRILLADDDLTTFDGLRSAVAFRSPDLSIDLASSVTEAVARIRVSHYAAIVTDLWMPGAPDSSCFSMYAGLIPVWRC